MNLLSIEHPGQAAPVCEDTCDWASGIGWTPPMLRGTWVKAKMVRSLSLSEPSNRVRTI